MHNRYNRYYISIKVINEEHYKGSIPDDSDF